MGILNITPDSFYDGGKCLQVSEAIQKARQMGAEGVDIIDIGAESTRPGAVPISEDEEIKKLVPIIKQIRKEISLPVSVDTYKARVAEKVLDLGVHLINDISGLHFDPRMAEVIAEYKSGVILMHIQGTPRDMQKNPSYQRLIPEIKDYLEEGIKKAQGAGISLDQIIIDPGIGFGKTLVHNLQIIQGLLEFESLDRPILLGPSRKSFIGKVLDLPVEERLEGTLAACVVGIMKGAHMVRVHDVKAAVRACKVADAIFRPQQFEKPLS